eukprot:TRINITY_DN1143_c0_g1_i5.p1 TRINITY_DN1143_c0_g1~~TRINITY_DN1143_c0_g1_i5.p1  ORF type:complete len:478 (-),score=87.19 TRINITY_DN1143_c0_g1_i5:382-1815(-)
MAPLCSHTVGSRHYEANCSDYEAVSLMMNPPRVVVDNDSDPEATIIEVDSVNRHGRLLKVIEILMDLDLVISKAHVSSDGGWFVDVFHVTDENGQKIDQQLVLERIQQALGVAPAASPPRAVVRSDWTSGLSIQKYTSVEFTGPDRPEVLSSVCSSLAQWNCNIVGADWWTHDGKAACVLHLTDQTTGGAIIESDRLKSIRESLEKLEEDCGSSGSSTHGASPLEESVNVERRLHQMMLDVGVSPTVKSSLAEKAQISVEDCWDMMYTIVTVRCVDRPKLFFDAACTLTDMQYMIFHATADARDGMAYQEHYIRKTDGRRISDEEKVMLVRCLQAAIDRGTPQGSRLELCAKDRTGLLCDIVRCFYEHNLIVTHAHIMTKGPKAINIFYVADTLGREVLASTLESVQAEILGSTLQFKPPLHASMAALPGSETRSSNSSSSNGRAFSLFGFFGLVGSDWFPSLMPLGKAQRLKTSRW